jgi:hypothetical protein
VIGDLRAYGLEGGPGLPSGRLAHDHDQTVLVDGAAKFRVDISRDVGGGPANGSLLRSSSARVGWMDTEHDRVSDVTNARKPSGTAPQGDAIGKFPS